MSRNNSGGTMKYCPTCESIQVCAAVNPSQLGVPSGQRKYFTQYDDLQIFRRGLICQNCGNQWLSAEVEEKFLYELIELRDALKEIKANAELYIQESRKASVSLVKLTKSLSVLRALNINKSQT